jgi:hypothetical protein
MTAVPMFYRFDSTHTRAVQEVCAHVTDGNGVLIKRAPIIFMCQRGRIYSTLAAAAQLPNGGVPMNPPRQRTGNYPGRIDEHGNGASTIYIGVNEQAVFLDPNINEETGEVTTFVERYPAIPESRVTITYTR